MDFEVLAPGTLPAAALTARGPDHNLEYAAADDFQTVLGNALGSAAAAAPNRRSVAFSSASGALAGFAFTRDPAVTASLLHGHVLAPAKLRAIFLFMTGNGLPTTHAMTLPEFLAAGEAVVATVNMAAIPAALLVAAGDLFPTEAPADSGV